MPSSGKKGMSGKTTSVGVVKTSSQKKQEKKWRNFTGALTNGTVWRLKKAKKPSPADKVVQVVSKGQHAQTSKKDKKVKPEKKEKMEQKEDSEDDYSYSDPEFSDEREHEGTTEQDVAAVFAALKAKKEAQAKSNTNTNTNTKSPQQNQNKTKDKIEKPEVKTPEKKKTTVGDIDDIFNTLKTNKEAKAVAATAAAQLKKNINANSKKGADDKDFWMDSRGNKTKRKTVDGLLVYTYDELGIRADSGGTPLCPFDCDCCY